MKAGFAKSDITPRIGVELGGFGPFLTRHSTAIRDRLWARSCAFEVDGETALLVSCDLIGVSGKETARIRKIVSDRTRVRPDRIMVHCTHTHSAPAKGMYHGWGEADVPYNEILPRRIAAGCVEAFEKMEEARMLHAKVPCEGIGYNREYDTRPSLEEALDENWRPQKPELTDTECDVLKFVSADDERLLGFAACFGCHPVVCCQCNSAIHGDYPGVAMNLLERENPGSVGLFLQGAQGDVNTCVVHHPDNESLLALDVIASRFARSVRHGLEKAIPQEVDNMAAISREVSFTHKTWTVEKIRELAAPYEAILADESRTDEDRELRMAVVHALAFRELLERVEAGESLSVKTEVQGLRLGPVAFLACSFEIFQAIKNEVAASAISPIPLVMGLANDSMGYAPDRQTAAKGGYAVDVVPAIFGFAPYEKIHEELAATLIELDHQLNERPVAK